MNKSSHLKAKERRKFKATAMALQKEAHLEGESRMVRKQAEVYEATADVPTITVSQILGSVLMGRDAIPSEKTPADISGPPCFAGEITIQPKEEAVVFALKEYSKEQKNILGRTVFWVDGATSGGASGIGVVLKEYPARTSSSWSIHGYHIPRELDPIIVELLAILKALELAEQYIPHSPTSSQYMVIYSDCTFALARIRDGNTDQPRLQDVITRKIAMRSVILKSHGINIHLHWVPSHVRIPGNVLADRVAKRAKLWGGKEESPRGSNP